MKREQPRRTAKESKAENGPKPYDPKGLRDEVESFREILGQVLAFAKRMERKGIPSLLDKSVALGRAKEGIRSWRNAIQDAYDEALAKKRASEPSYPPETASPDAS
jgi:hypothetical protein